jgi:hypothetical protein
VLCISQISILIFRSIFHSAQTRNDSKQQQEKEETVQNQGVEGQEPIKNAESSSSSNKKVVWMSRVGFHNIAMVHGVGAWL